MHFFFSLHWLWDRTNKPQEPFGKRVWLLIFLGGPWSETAVISRVLRQRCGGQQMDRATLRSRSAIQPISQTQRSPGQPTVHFP